MRSAGTTRSIARTAERSTGPRASASSRVSSLRDWQCRRLFTISSPGSVNSPVWWLTNQSPLSKIIPPGAALVPAISAQALHCDCGRHGLPKRSVRSCLQRDPLSHDPDLGGEEKPDHRRMIIRLHQQHQGLAVGASGVPHLFLDPHSPTQQIKPAGKLVSLIGSNDGPSLGSGWVSQCHLTVPLPPSIALGGSDKGEGTIGQLGPSLHVGSGARSNFDALVSATRNPHDELPLVPGREVLIPNRIALLDAGDRAAAEGPGCAPALSRPNDDPIHLVPLSWCHGCALGWDMMRQCAISAMRRPNGERRTAVEHCRSKPRSR